MAKKTDFCHFPMCLSYSLYKRCLPQGRSFPIHTVTVQQAAAVAVQVTTEMNTAPPSSLDSLCPRTLS